MKIAYEAWSPGADALRDLGRADQIATEYADQGYDLTLRQLYYRFVARGWIPNTSQSYKRLGDVLNRGRLAGYIDWDHLIDRTRNLEENAHWPNPGSVIDAAARSYHNDLWIDQPWRVEIWVEKEALAGIVERAANRLDCAWFACRGYVSQSEMWAAAQRHKGYVQNGQRVMVLHLGDHDPSGIDMTRDIRDRLTRFLYSDIGEELGRWSIGEELDVSELEMEVESAYFPHDDPEDLWYQHVAVERIALNMDQVRRYNPPPNPAKLTDSRVGPYIRAYGNQSWELDALDPATLDALIEAEVRHRLDTDLMDSRRQQQEHDRQRLSTVARRWPRVLQLIESDQETP